MRRAVAALFVAIGLPAASFAAEPPPFKLYDTHAHFISPDFVRYPLRIPAPIPGVPPNPATANLPERIERNPTDAERILQLWDRHGVAGGAGVQYRTAYGTDNTYLLDAAAAAPGRIAPIVLLDALDANTPYILRSMVRDARVAGARFSGALDSKSGEFLWLTSRSARETWQAANELGAVLVLMPVPSNTPDAKVLEVIARNAKAYPRVRVVLDHFAWVHARGAPDYGLTAAHYALKDLPNVYFKLSSIVLEMLHEAKLPSADFVRHAADTFGAQRIMWGSDVGNTTVGYGEMVELAWQSVGKLSPREQRQVLHDTGNAVHVRGGQQR